MKDKRFVYGARCCWFGSISEVGHTNIGLPCCPHCGSVLYEMPDEATWWDGVDRYEAAGHLGYRAMVEWMRGKHFRSPDEGAAAYAAHMRDVKTD
ncbi:hypothetical protein [Pleomorphomonas koreensis]|uniref:hypothetical protein n=1 Tax=Pleomorphomonas koreensis TaxID=257440 RepID=UPI0004024BBA|nr:hypothetical protein [Pleomorphomonas koreensis]